jgi:hypothetical protein
MTLTTAQFTLDTTSLPTQSKELGVLFVRRAVKGIKEGSPAVDRILMLPHREAFEDPDVVGPEPRWNHLVCGVGLETGDGKVVAGSGQMVITPQRYLFMVDDGDVNRNLKLDVNSTGNVYCFSVLREDVYDPEVKKKRLQPSQFFLRGKEEAPIKFRIAAYAAYAYIVSDHMGYWQDKSMIRALSEEGRQALLKE